MRAVALCLVSGGAALASAVALLAPGAPTDPETIARLAPVARRLDRDPTEAALPPVRLLDSPPRVALAPAPLIERPAAVNSGPPTNPSGAVAADVQQLQLQLLDAQSRLRDAERRLTRLVEDHCRERFDFELDRWLDGPVGWLCFDDFTLRQRVREALVATAEEHNRDRIWDPDLQEWHSGECPEAVDELRARIPDALVAQLIRHFRDWDRERSWQPRIEFTARMVLVTLDGEETAFLSDDPYVQSLRAERDRIDWRWQRRINALLDADVFEPD